MTVTWHRHLRRPTLRAVMQGVDTQKQIVDFEDLGIERVTAEPLYRNGEFCVVDTVKDLEYVVVWQHDGGMVFLSRVLFSLDDAAEQCDAYRGAQMLERGEMVIQ